MLFSRPAAMLTVCLFSLSAMAFENGVSEAKIVLGQSAVFSGDSAELGIRANLGASVYFDALNARGGINGRKIELLKDDDNFEPANAAENSAHFIETDKVFALFGYVGSTTSNAALTIAKKTRVPLFAPFSGAPELRDPAHRHVFNIRASLNDEIRHTVEQLAVMGTKRIAVFYQNDADGKSGLNAVIAVAKTAGISIVDTVTVERNAMGVAGASQKLMANKPDAVIQLCTYLPAATLIKEMRKAGYLGQFFNTSMVGSSAFAAALGKDGVGVTISQVVPLPWNTRYAIVSEYQKAMQKAGHKEYDFTSLEAYIAAKTFSEIANKLGKDLSRERFIKMAETMGNLDLGGYTINFAPNNHNGSHFVEMVVIGKNGSFLR
jgi:branched-chain amino acid transport system substrate-binding protein